MHWNWTRFGYHRGETLRFDAGGFPYDPRELDGALQQGAVSLDTMLAEPCVVLLGEPGIGKSDTMLSLSRRSNRPNVFIDLRDHPTLGGEPFQRPEFLEWLNGKAELELIIDSLDEGPSEFARVLKGKLSAGPIDRLRLRLACRTGLFPDLLDEHLRELWPNCDRVYELMPLCRADVELAAGNGASAFVSVVERHGCAALAIRPITLNFLLGVFTRGNGRFPSSRWQLYADGCRHLAEEASKSRRSDGKVGNLTPGQRMAVASRIAAVCLLGNKALLQRDHDLGQLPDEAVPRRALAGGLEGDGPDAVVVDDTAVRETLQSTSLFTDRGQHCLGFAHADYASFLTAWYLEKRGLGSADVLELFVATVPEAPLPQPLRDVLKWWADRDESLRERLLAHEPAALLHCDLQQLPEEQRATLCRVLLEGIEAKRIIDSEVRPYYRGLKYRGIADDLIRWICDKTRSVSTRSAAIYIADACACESLQELLITLVLNREESPHVRALALHAVSRIENPSGWRKLLPVIRDSDFTVPDRFSRIRVLRLLWPDILSASELIECLDMCIRAKDADISFFIENRLLPGIADGDIYLFFDWLTRLPLALQQSRLLEAMALKLIERVAPSLQALPVFESVKRLLAVYAKARVHLVPVYGVLPLPKETRRYLLAALVPDTPLERLTYYTLRGVGLIAPEDATWLAERCNEDTSNRSIWECLSTGLEDELQETAQRERLAEEDRKGRRTANRERLENVTRMANLFAAGDGSQADEIIWNIAYIHDDDNSDTGRPDFNELSALYGWTAIGSDLRAKVLTGTRLFLADQTQVPDALTRKPWRPTEHCTHYTLLRLLRSTEIGWLSEQELDFWTPLAGAVVFRRMGRDEDEHRELLEMASRLAPGPTRWYIAALVDRATDSYDVRSALYVAKTCLGDEAQEFLTKKLMDDAYPETPLRGLLLQLLRWGACGDVASMWIRSGASDMLSRRRAAAAAEALLLTDSAQWPELVDLFERDVALGRVVFPRIAETMYPAQSNCWDHIDEAAVANLYRWAETQYPESDDLSHEVTGRAAEASRQVSMLRHSLLLSLQERGSARALTEIDNLKAHLPHLRFEYVRLRALARLSRRSWQPLAIEDVLRLRPTPQPAGRTYGELEIELHRGPQDSGYGVTLRLTDPRSEAENGPVRGSAALAPQDLRALQLSHEDYGRSLTAQLFSDKDVRAFFGKAQVLERGGLLLRIRLAIDPSASELHDLRWELLQDPESGTPLATSERILLSRFMPSQDWRVVELPSNVRLRAIIAVAAPSDHEYYGLAAISVDNEIDRVSRALTRMDLTVMGRGHPLTIQGLVDALRMGIHVLYLVCHGMFSAQREPVLFLQNESGKAERVKGIEFARHLKGVSQLPSLIVLVSCESAGRDGSSALINEQSYAHASSAAMLVNAGVPAVLAMQGRISMPTAQILIPMFFRELFFDGQIDRALAVARSAVRHRQDYWVPVLFLRLKHGRLWNAQVRAGVGSKPATPSLTDGDKLLPTALSAEAAEPLDHASVAQPVASRIKPSDRPEPKLALPDPGKYEDAIEPRITQVRGQTPRDVLVPAPVPVVAAAPPPPAPAPWPHAAIQPMTFPQVLVCVGLVVVIVLLLVLG